MRLDGNAVAISATFAALLIGSPLHAEQITFEIHAVIDQLIDPDHALAGQISKGDSIKGTYTYDMDAIDTDSSPQYGHFSQINFNNNGFDLRINELSTRSTNNSNPFFHTISTSNGKTDYYYIESKATSPLGTDYVINNINLEIFDYTGNALTSDKLTREPPSMAKAEDRNLLISGNKNGTGGFFDIKARITDFKRITSVAGKR